MDTLTYTAILARVTNPKHDWPLLDLSDNTTWALVSEAGAGAGHLAESPKLLMQTLTFRSRQCLFDWYQEVKNNARNKLLMMARYASTHGYGLVTSEAEVNLWEAFIWYEVCADSEDKQSCAPVFESLTRVYGSEYREYRDMANPQGATLDQKIALIGVVSDLYSVTYRESWQLKAALTKLAFDANDEEWDRIKRAVQTLSDEAQDLTRERERARRTV